ncbi:response regulator [Aliiglaciecola litoralis]|uniref:histidine kinase n=1 Tax=Aliiglaciecola litoralis TaxID=582857 RepID=A0ABN1LPE2_9ALTE
MGELLDSLFRSDYMPHGHCYSWKPEILWLNIVSDVLIAFAYFSIPIAIYYFVRKRKDLEFKGIFILFSLFILLCGMTHLVSIFVIWHGAYGIHGLAKLATAIVSCVTAYHLFKSIPMAVQLPSVVDVQQAFEKASSERLERLKLEHEREQDVMLRESTDSAHIGILVIDEEGSILVANEGAVNIFNYSKSELEGQCITKLFAQTIGENYLNLLKSTMGGEQAKSKRGSGKLLAGRTKSGIEIPIEASHSRREFANRPVIFISLQDISARLASQQALQAIENMTSSIIDSLPVGLQVWELRDQDLYLTRFNQAAVSILQIEFEALLGMRLEEAFPDVKGSPIPDAYRKVAQYGGTWVDESYLYDDGDVSGIFELTCFQSNPNTAIVLFEDVTEKRMAQQAIEEKDMFISTAFDASVTGVYIYNLETGSNEFINQSYTNITGYNMRDLAEMSAKEFLSLFHPDDQALFDQHLTAIKQSSSTDKGFDIEYRFKHKQGHWIWCWSKDVVFDRDKQGNVRSFMGSFLDITDLKEMQANLVELKNSAEKANEAKSEFLANMSHEIRTPMNAILGLTKLVLDMELGEQQAQYLSNVEASSKSLLNVLNDILDFSKMEAGKLEIVNEDFDLEELIESSVGLFSLVAEEKNIELVVDINPEMSRFYVGDSMRLNQILNNLIGNAIKFTPQGHIHISVDVVNNGQTCLHFKVVDSGIGMSHEQCARLFASFSQADTSVVRKYGGTGLGLSISKGLANLMGGEIAVESELGKGSKFSLIVPVTISDRTYQQLHQPLRPMSTLLVEDNESAQICLNNVLQSWGFEVELCSDGEQAMALLEQRKQHSKPFELFVVDWKMADLNGLELLKKIQSDPVKYGLNDESLFIVATAFGRQHAAKHAKDIKIDAFLDKPILNSRLSQTIQRLQSQEPGSDQQNHLPQKSDSQAKYTASSVLLVEDIMTNQLVAKEFLKRFGIKPIVASHGQEALELFQQHSFDLVLMDLQMPVMDGLTATREIRLLKGGESIPIIAMSAAVMELDIARVKSAGMNGHIAKPIDISKLANVLQQWLTEDAVEDEHVKKIDLNDSTIDANQSTDGAMTYQWPKDFDVALALKQLGNDPGLYQKLLRIFYHEFVKAPEEIFDLWERKQIDALKILAHSLKGVARTIGANTLCDIAAYVEENVDSIDADDVHKLTAVLSQDINSVVAVLGDETLDYSTLKTQASGTEHRYNKLISSLLSKLEDGMFLSLDNIKTDLPDLAACFSENEFNQLTKAIDDLNYSLAITILKGRVPPS